MKELGFEVPLSRPFEESIDLVTAALQKEGFGILTRINVRDTLQQKLGVEFRPYSILGACHPSLAHQALSADPRVGLMLPCNVTVEATGKNESLVRIADPEVLMNLGGMDTHPTLRKVAEEARHRLLRVAESLEI